MQLAYALLANFAGFLQDNRLVLAGADFETIASSEFPVIMSVAFVAKMRLMPDEELEGHWYRLDLTRPNGDRENIAPQTDLQTMRNQDFPDRPSGASIVVNLMMGFETEGDHVFHLIVDDQEVSATVVTAIEMPNNDEAPAQ